jgi:predicted amidohydrolase
VTTRLHLGKEGVLKIGFLQFAPILGDLQPTLRTIDRLCAVGSQADLLVLPELCNSGYHFESPHQAWETSEEIGASIFIRHLVALAQQHNLHLVSGFNERDGDSLYNSAILIGPSGYVGKYRKLHLFSEEKDHFQPGNIGLPVFHVGAYRIGLLVCFDWVFPEVWRILALKGADVICHPSNLVLPGLAQGAVPIHALTNRIFVVTANRVGAEGDLLFTGLSTIADPGGTVLLQASPSEEEVGIVDIDPALARDKSITARNDVLCDRRPEEYSLLVETGPLRWHP